MKTWTGTTRKTSPGIPSPIWACPSAVTAIPTIAWCLRTGSGQEGNSDTLPSINLGPGETRNFITYFGLSQDKLKATATPFHSPSPTHSATATFSATLT